jgi:hypothetical protein
MPARLTATAFDVFPGKKRDLARFHSKNMRLKNTVKYSVMFKINDDLASWLAQARYLAIRFIVVSQYIG